MQVIRDSELMRLLDAVHLVSGMSEDALLGACLEVAIERLHLILQEHVDDAFPDLTGARRCTVDWSSASVELERIDAALDGESCECQAIITTEGTVSFPVVSGVGGGEELPGFGTTECRVGGSLLVTLTVEDGHVAVTDVDDDRIKTQTVGED